MNRLRASFAPYWQSIQHALFPQLEPVLGPLTAKQQQLVRTLEVIRIEQWVPERFRVPGRPPKDRAAIARAFVAKAVYDMPTTRVLLDRLDTDVALRRLCGWEKRSEVPSESVFSRAFAEFAHTQLPERVHEALVRATHHDRLVGHLSRDSTAIEAREKPAPTDKAPPPPKRKRGRPRKGEQRPKVLKRLDRQATMSLPAMLDDLPTGCDVGTKSRVDDWRGGGRRRGVAVAGGFRGAGASLPAVAPSPVAAHRTGRADFPHPALGRDHAFAHGKLVGRNARRVSPYSVRSRSSGKRTYFPDRTLCLRQSHWRNRRVACWSIAA